MNSLPRNGSAAAPAVFAPAIVDVADPAATRTATSRHLRLAGGVEGEAPLGNARGTAITQIDRSDASSCASVTIQLPSRAGDAPLLVTLDLCDWLRVARQIVDAAAAVG